MLKPGFCTTGKVEDEKHFLIDCSFYDDLRFELFNLAQNILNGFLFLDSFEKLSFLMSCNELVFKLSKTLLCMSQRRKRFV